MSTTFYKITPGGDDSWHLRVDEHFADGTPLDIWAYSGCRTADDTRRVPVRVFQLGTPVDYYPTAFLTTIVSKRLADCWAKLAGQDIQRISADIRDDAGEWEVVVILPCIDCIDHNRSKISYHPANHPTKPNKPLGVLKLVLDPNRIGDHEIFHPKDWEVVTVISARVKAAMEAMGTTGVEYWPVTE